MNIVKSLKNFFLKNKNEIPKATATFKGVGELLVQPNAQLENAMSNGSSVYYNVSFSFPEPIRLYGANKDKLKIIIQDDLSNLTELKATAIGWEELIN